MPWNLMVQLHVSFQGAGVAATSCLETNMRHPTAGFSTEIAEIVAADHRKPMACLYQGKWLIFLHWCHVRTIAPHKATVQ